MSTSHRLVALFARWSYDHWSEINDGTPRAAELDQGPDEHNHMLSAVFDNPPSAEEVAAALRASVECLGNEDGKSELLEYAVLDEKAWDAFLGKAAQWFRGNDGHESPTIHYNASLRAAHEVAARSGTTFTAAGR
jgi:hypothetical protein